MAPKRKSEETEELDTLGAELADISCELCRVRKLKCSRELPLCGFCKHRGEASCVYQRITRTPLTRKSLDAAEARIVELEALVAAAGLQTPALQEVSPAQGSQDGTVATADSRAAGTSLQSLGTPADVALAALVDRNNTTLASVQVRMPDAGTLQFSIPQGSSSSAQLFELEDAVDPEEGQGDGTGSLLIDGSGSGFLGSISGAALLKFLQRCATDVQLLSSTRQQKQVNSSSPQSSTYSTAPHPERAPMYLDAYFHIFHKQYPLVHEASFRAQLADVIPRPGGQSWHVLHAAILGLGSLCVAESPDHSDSHAYLSKINTLVKPSLYDSPNLTSVAAFTLLGNLAQKLNKPATGSIYLGIALRMAITLGLHREPHEQGLTVFEQESRRRVWWTLFVFDSGSQITFGHPSTLPTHGVNVWPVTNAPDQSLTPNTLFSPAGYNTPTIYSSLLHQASFHQLTNRITAQISQRPISAHEALVLDAELTAWQGSLPSYFFSDEPGWFDFARCRMVWRYHNMRMIVLRPSFFRAAWPQGELTMEDEACWERCLSSAVATIESVQSFMSSNMTRSSMEWWYALHFLFSACFVPLIALRTRSASSSSFEWLLAVQNALAVLERVKHNTLASRCAEIIEAIVARVQHPYAQTQTPQLGLPINLLPLFGNDQPAALSADPLASALATPFDALIAQWLSPEGKELVV